MSEPVEANLWSWIVKAAPSFLGAVVAAVYIQRPVSKLEGFIAIFAGFFTAVFVAPYVASVFAPGNPHALSGFSFGIGLFTVTLLPVFIRRLQELIAALQLSDFLGVFKKKE